MTTASGDYEQVRDKVTMDLVGKTIDWATAQQIVALLELKRAAKEVIAASAVEFEDPRIGYRTMQIEKAEWDALVAAVKELE